MGHPNVRVTNFKGGRASLYISGTGTHTGLFMAITATAAAVAALVSTDMEGTLTSVAIPVGVTIYGTFTSITLASGAVIAYKG